MQTIEQLVAVSEGFDEGKHDHLMPVGQLLVTEAGSLTLPPTLMGSLPPLSFEEHSFAQFVRKSAPGLYTEGKKASMPVDYNWQLHETYPDLFANTFNRYLETIGNDKQWMVRAHNTDLRAVLSDRYADLPNSELLDMTAQVLEGLDYKLGACNVGRDSMIIRVIVKDLPRPLGTDVSGFGFGIMVRNDEVGRGSAQVAPVLQRTTCTNSIVAIRDENGEAMGVRLVHIGSAKMKLGLIAAAIAEVLPNAEKMLDKYAEATVAEIPKLPALIAKLGEKYKWGDEIQSAVSIGTEGKMTHAGLVNGLTFAAQTVDGQEDRLRMEQLGGEMLFTAAAKLVSMSEGAMAIPTFSLVEAQEQ